MHYDREKSPCPGHQAPLPVPLILHFPNWGEISVAVTCVLRQSIDKFNLALTSLTYSSWWSIWTEATWCSTSSRAVASTRIERVSMQLKSSLVSNFFTRRALYIGKKLCSIWKQPAPQVPLQIREVPPIARGPFVLSPSPPPLDCHCSHPQDHHNCSSMYLYRVRPTSPQTKSNSNGVREQGPETGQHPPRLRRSHPHRRLWHVQAADLLGPDGRHLLRHPRLHGARSNLVAPPPETRPMPSLPP